ncbi:MAG: energy transducer TonB [Desulfomonilaceae bacterium]|nr:energy transducer TonB [Desulfomonilaceae bacterium]
MMRLIPFLFFSILFHGMILGTSVPWINRVSSPGHPRVVEENLYVEVVAEQEFTAAALTPSAVDTAASAKSQPTKEPERPKETRQDQPPAEEKPEPTMAQDEADPSPTLLVTKTEEPRADFVESDKEVPEPPEKPTEQKQFKEIVKEKPPEKETDISVKEDKKEPEEDNKEERPESKPSIAQIASRQSVFRASPGHDLADFKAKVIAAIRKASYYPRKAARNKKRGEVVVSFRIWKDGKVDGIEIKRSSGSDLLDQAAIETVRKAIQNFPDVPASLRTDPLGYAVPIVFKGKGGVKN